VTDEEWHQYWIDERFAWYTGLGINPDNLRLYEHPKEKLSHYSKRTVDIEYRFGFSSGSLVSSRASPTGPTLISPPTAALGELTCPISTKLLKSAGPRM
jgi:hypothetical protein